MPRNTAYFDSQASAAASLGIDIYEIPDAKSAGCPAFRSGRVYRDELLTWLEEKKLERIHSASSHSDEGKNRQRMIARTMVGLADCANLGLLTDDQHFEFGKTIVEAAQDKDILHVFISVVFEWLCDTFPELPDAYKAHPKIVKWLFQQADERRRREKTKQEKRARG